MKMIDSQAAMGFVISQTSHIEQAIYQIRYPEIQYPGLIPVDTSAHPFAKTVTYFSSDKFGRAEWINGNADDVPTAGTDLSKHEVQVFMAGIGYKYGYEEINQAMMLGHNLSDDHARAARRAYEEMVDRVALEGDAQKGMSGLFDHPDIPVVAPVNGTWTDPSRTGDQILADVNGALAGIHVNTRTVELADTLILPWSHFHLISTKRLGDTQDTVLGFLRRENIYTAQTGQPLTIRGVRGLETRGSSGLPRMITYRRNPEVLKLHIPMPHRFLPVHQSGPLTWEIPGVFRLAGLDVRLPRAIAYTDGI